MADIAQACAALDKALRQDEGERLKPYRCSAGVPTIGVGATTYLDGRKVTMADPPITREQMDRMLAVEIERYTAEVLDMVDRDATTNQLVGLVRCGYNIGLAALRTSSMVRLHRQGDFAAAARAFSLWNKRRDPKTGQLVEDPALTARRLREAATYATHDADAETPAPTSPQAVAPEPPMVTSPTVQASSGGLVVSAVAVVSQWSDPVKDVAHKAREVAESVGVNPGIAVAVAAGLVCALVLYRRWQQRRRGMA